MVPGTRSIPSRWRPGISRLGEAAPLLKILLLVVHHVVVGHDDVAAGGLNIEVASRGAPMWIGSPLLTSSVAKIRLLSAVAVCAGRHVAILLGVTWGFAEHRGDRWCCDNAPGV